MSPRVLAASFALAFTGVAALGPAADAAAAEARLHGRDLYRVKGVDEPAIVARRQERRLHGHHVRPHGGEEEVAALARRRRRRQRPRADLHRQARLDAPLLPRRPDARLRLHARGRPRRSSSCPWRRRAAAEDGLPGRGRAPLFSADGRGSSSPPTCAPSAAPTPPATRRSTTPERSRRSRRTSPTGSSIRHWTDWKDGKRTHVLVLDLAGEDGAVRDLTPGDFDSPAFALGGASDFAFSPDGKELAFTSNRERRRGLDHERRPVDGADRRAARGARARRATSPRPTRRSTARRLLAGRPVPRLPDAAGAGYEADRFRIALYDRAAATSRVLTESFDNTSATSPGAPDAKTDLLHGRREGPHAAPRARSSPRDRIRVLPRVGLLDAFEVSRDGPLRRRRAPPDRHRRRALARRPARKAASPSARSRPTTPASKRGRLPARRGDDRSRQPTARRSRSSSSSRTASTPRRSTR